MTAVAVAVVVAAETSATSDAVDLAPHQDPPSSRQSPTMARSSSTTFPFP